MASGGSPGQRDVRSDAHRNRERVVHAGIEAVHRDGLAVPMATIAADAGVGIATLYRHFPTREELLDELTHRSFRLMVSHLQDASAQAGTGVDVLRGFLRAVIADRSVMVLPTTGGPTVSSDRTLVVQTELHTAIERVLARGADDRTIRRDVAVWDVAWLGAVLSQPDRPGGSWDAIALRLLDTYLAGLGVP